MGCKCSRTSFAEMILLLFFYAYSGRCHINYLCQLECTRASFQPHACSRGHRYSAPPYVGFLALDDILCNSLALIRLSYSELEEPLGEVDEKERPESSDSGHSSSEEATWYCSLWATSRQSIDARTELSIVVWHVVISL